MKRAWSIYAGLVFLGVFVGPLGTLQVPSADATAAETPATSFKLRGSHGYSIWAFPHAGESGTSGSIELVARRRNAAVSYRGIASVTSDSIHAELGDIARVDVVRVPSGRRKTVHPKCVGGRWTYEPGTYEGVIKFTGEHGYTRARASRVAALPDLLLFSAHDPCGGGYGEAIGADQPGARLRGISFAHGRILSFQVNKNRPRAKTFFTASLKERRHGVRIERALNGVAPSGAFSFDSQLQTATLSPPAPFLGSASLSRRKDLFSPAWSGGLTLAFPGQPVPLAGPGVHVSIAHAHFTRSSRPEVEVGF